MNKDTSNNSKASHVRTSAANRKVSAKSIPSDPLQELLQDLSDTTDSLQDELDETIEALRDVAAALKSWNAELEKTARDLDK